MGISEDDVSSGLVGKMPGDDVSIGIVLGKYEAVVSTKRV